MWPWVSSPINNGTAAVKSDPALQVICDETGSVKLEEFRGQSIPIFVVKSRSGGQNFFFFLCNDRDVRPSLRKQKLVSWWQIIRISRGHCSFLSVQCIDIFLSFSKYQMHFKAFIALNSYASIPSIFENWPIQDKAMYSTSLRNMNLEWEEKSKHYFSIRILDLILGSFS